MSLHSTSEIPALDRNGLRRFGLTTGAIVAALFGLVLPWLLEFPLPMWPWIVFGVLSVWALAAPTTLELLYRGWMYFGLAMSKMTTPIIMGMIFFLLIAPIGLVMRVARRDAMQRSFDSSLPSYRVVSEKRTAENLEKPF
jgi:hypothetical protein